MSQIVKLRRSSTGGNRPTNSQLQLGELAINTTDGKLYFAKSGSLNASIEEVLTTNAQNTGSFNLTGSINVVGTESITGSTYISGTLRVYGDTSLTSLIISGSDSVANLQAFLPDSSIYNNAGFNTPNRVASGVRFNWNNENWTIGAARGLTTDVDGLVFSRNGERNLLLDEDSNLSLSGSMYITGGLYINGSSVGTGKLDETTFNTYTGSVSSQFAGTSSYASYALTASYVANPTLVSGSTKKTTVTSAATTWSLNHGMNERYPSITVFDSDGYVVIPTGVRAIDSNNIEVYFSEAQTGTVIATLGGGGTSGSNGTSGTSGETGTSGSNGSSGTSGTNGSSGTSGSNGSSGVSGTNGSSGTSGRDGIGGATQTFASSTTWSVFHNLDIEFPVVTVWDDTRNIIIPSRIESVDNNNLNVYFPLAVSGSINVVRGGHMVSGAVDLSSALLSSNIVSSSIQGTNLGFAITGSNTFKGDQTFSGSLIPVGSGSYDLGTATNPFRHLYLSSASLYIDGQKVLGSTNQELQITTDNGQSIKILESGTDTITFQTADGDIQLKSSGGGNVLIDPTNGLIDVRGSLQIQDGYKIKSSNGTNVVFDDNIIVSGSANFTNGITIGGVSYESATSGTSGSSGSSGSNGTSGDSIFAQTGSIWSATKDVEITGSLKVKGSITADELYMTYVTSSVMYSSGSTKFGDTNDDTHQFTGSLNITGSLLINGTSYTAATSGTSGSSGSSGSNGTDGTSGSSGSNGTSGSSGTSGSNGTSGSSGTSITTSGTNNTLTKFTSSTTVGNATNLTDDGTTFRIAENTLITGSLTIGASSSTFPVNVYTSSANTFGTIAEFWNGDFTAGTRTFIRVRNAVSAGGTYSSYFGQGQDGKTYIIANNSARGGDIVIDGNNGNTTFSGTITENSSIRYKDNIEDLKYGLDKVLQMRGVSYTKKDSGVKEIGLIAEELNEIVPELVNKNEEGLPDSVSYGRVVSYLIEAIKEQQKQIEELKSLLK